MSTLRIRPIVILATVFGFGTINCSQEPNSFAGKKAELTSTRPDSNNSIAAIQKSTRDNNSHTFTETANSSKEETSSESNSSGTTDTDTPNTSPSPQSPNTANDGDDVPTSPDQTDQTDQTGETEPEPSPEPDVERVDVTFEVSGALNTSVDESAIRACSEALGNQRVIIVSGSGQIAIAENEVLYFSLRGNTFIRMDADSLADSAKIGGYCIESRGGGGATIRTGIAATSLYSDIGGSTDISVDFLSSKQDVQKIIGTGGGSGRLQLYSILDCDQIQIATSGSAQVTCSADPIP